jgi:rare lipoprotein A
MRLRGFAVAFGIAAAMAISAAGAAPPAANPGLGFTGKAAYYSPDYSGTVASGEQYDPTKFTAAHKTLPFGTRLLVTDLKTRCSVTVTVNDRGPFTHDRVIDLSLAAARALKMIGRGIIRVKVVRAPDAGE